MYVRLLYGPTAGKVEFLATPIARKLIENGRAEDPTIVPEIPQVVANKVPAAANTHNVLALRRVARKKKGK